MSDVSFDMSEQSHPTSTYGNYGGYASPSDPSQQQQPPSTYNNMGFYATPGQPQQAQQQQGVNNFGQYGGQQQFQQSQQQSQQQQQQQQQGGAGFNPNILGNLDSDVAKQIGLTYGSQAFQAGHDYLNTNVNEAASFSLCPADSMCLRE